MHGARDRLENEVSGSRKRQEQLDRQYSHNMVMAREATQHHLQKKNVLLGSRHH